MRYVAAYLLSVLGAKENPSVSDIEKILGAVGIETESEKLNKVLSELKGKKLDEVIAAGQSKLASMPSGGAVASATAAAPAATESKKEEKKEEKKVESEEEDDDMGFGLFD